MTCRPYRRHLSDDRKQLAAEGFSHPVFVEMDAAAARYGPPASAAESYGVLAEEVAEVLDAIRTRNLAAVKAEAIQVAATALRLAEWVDAQDDVPIDEVRI